MSCPAAVPALALLAGITIGFFHPGLPAGSLIAGVGVLWGSAVAAFGRGSTKLFALVASAGFVAVGVSLGSGAATAAVKTPLVCWYTTNPTATRHPVRIEGRLARDATPTDYGASLLVAADRLQPAGRSVPASGGLRVAVGGQFVADRIGQWRAGRRVRMPVSLRQAPRYANPGLPDQRRTLAWRGISLLGSVKSGLLVEVIEHGSLGAEAAGAVRASVRRSVDRWVGVFDVRSAAIVTAVLIGDRAGLDPATQRRLQEAGTFHVIAISGGNIAIFSGVLLLALRVAGVPTRTSALVTVGCLLAYRQVVGSEASVARATFAAATFLAARAVDHRAPPLNTLALAAACLLGMAPLSIVDAGFLLTFGATLGILLGVPRLVAAIRPWVATERRVGAWLVMPALMLLCATICAELALFPIAATAFSRISVAGLALNFVAIPLMTVTQVAGTVTAVLGTIETDLGLMKVPGYVAHLAATGIVESARLVDLAPWLARRVPAPAIPVVAIYYASWLCWLWRPRRAARVLATALLVGTGAVMMVAPVTLGPMRRPTGAGCSTAGQPLRVWFLDVDQADATAVLLPDGRSLLVDAAGTVRGSFDVGARIVAPVLWHAGVRRLDYVVVSHGDPDHIGGAPAVLDDFRPREIWEGVPVPPSRPLAHLRALALDRGAAWRTLQTGDVIRADRVEVRVWHPPLPDWERQRVRNDDSLVLEIRYGAVSFILPGDISREVEAELAGLIPPAGLRVLKVPHHGSRTSSSAAFIDGLRPAVVVVSAGRENRFGHPHPDVVRRYEQAGARLLRTDEVGAVMVCSDGSSVDLRTHSGERLSLKGSW